MKGKIPFQDATEKIIRMSGKSSDVSDYTIDRFGIYNFLLIYENPELVQNIVRDHSDDKVVPVFGTFLTQGMAIQVVGALPNHRLRIKIEMH